ncbi:MAG: helix-turn-helix domain-containing protein [Acidobacteriaceae bacterium]|nr:helix-turn-helix domain-containing protein [Acidobacteriaceae bacterium]
MKERRETLGFGTTPSDLQRGLERMMKLQDVILKAMGKKITWLEAAEVAGVTDRTIRRMRERYQEFGYDGLLDQ